MGSIFFGSYKFMPLLSIRGLQIKVVSDLARIAVQNPTLTGLT